MQNPMAQNISVKRKKRSIAYPEHYTLTIISQMQVTLSLIGDIFQVVADLVALQFIPVDLGPGHWKLASKSFESCVGHGLVVFRDCRLKQRSENRNF